MKKNNYRLERYPLHISAHVAGLLVDFRMKRIRAKHYHQNVEININLSVPGEKSQEPPSYDIIMCNQHNASGCYSQESIS